MLSVNCNSWKPQRNHNQLLIYWWKVLKQLHFVVKQRYTSHFSHRIFEMPLHPSSFQRPFFYAKTGQSACNTIRANCCDRKCSCWTSGFFLTVAFIHVTWWSSTLHSFGLVFGNRTLCNTEFELEKWQLFLNFQAHYLLWLHGGTLAMTEPAKDQANAIEVGDSTTGMRYNASSESRRSTPPMNWLYIVTALGHHCTSTFVFCLESHLSTDDIGWSEA